MRQLEDELQRTKDQLRTTIEQYEAATEEHKAANEELQAINEELRATTEELETSREELQSINEELTTINQEMQHKVEEVGQSNNDLLNLMASTQIATIFVDRELRIKRYTPSAQAIFNLIPSDINRPLAHIAHQLDYDQLAADAARVRETLAQTEREIQSQEGRWYLARLLPYRTLDDTIDGVTLTFVDITDRKQIDEALHESQLRLTEILQQLPIAVLVAEPEGTITFANTRAEELFGGPQRIEDYRLWQSFTTTGQPYTAAQIPLARALLAGEIVGREELHLKREGETELILSVNAAPIRNQRNQIIAAVAAYEDITIRKQAEQALQQMHAERAQQDANQYAALQQANESLRAEVHEQDRAETTQRRRGRQLVEMLQQLSIGILIVDATGRQVFSNQWGEEIDGPTEQDRNSVTDDHTSQIVTHDVQTSTPEQALFVRALRQGETIIGEEMRFPRADGSWRICRVFAAPLRDTQGQIVGAVAVFEDLSPQHDA
jgi:PAS domain S-box-containing protein